MTPKSLMAASLVMLLVGAVAAVRHAPSPPTRSGSVVNDHGGAVEDTGQLTLAQAKQEIFDLRARFAPQPNAHAQRAAPGRS